MCGTRCMAQQLSRLTGKLAPSSAHQWHLRGVRVSCLRHRLLGAFTPAGVLPVARLLQRPVTKSHDSRLPSASPCTSSGHTPANDVPAVSPGPGVLLGRLGRMSLTLRPLQRQRKQKRHHPSDAQLWFHSCSHNHNGNVHALHMPFFGVSFRRACTCARCVLQCCNSAAHAD